MRIRCYPDPVLARPAVEIDEIHDDLIRAAQEMLEVMYGARGVGLAGPQVGLERRLVVINFTGRPDDELMVVNPAIVERQGTVEAEEGCLSLPGLFSKITRSESVLVQAFDLDGKELQFEAEGLPARVWQHEIDHLDGTLIVDRMSAVRRLAASRALKEMERLYQPSET